jgi:hypothetical protein
MAIHTDFKDKFISADIVSLKATVAPEIPKGEQKITANVTISYEIR